MATEKSLGDYAGVPFLSGKNFRVGDKVEAEVVEYLGFQSYTSADGEVETSSPLYKIQTKADEFWRFRLSKTNASVLINRGLKSYEDLVGKRIVLLVVATNKGNSFQIVDVADVKKV